MSSSPGFSDVPAWPHWDVIVIGLGGTGSAAAHRLAERGQRILGLEQGAPPGDAWPGARFGVLQQARFTEPAYQPLMRRATELWHEVERQTGREIVDISGSLVARDPGVAAQLDLARLAGAELHFGEPVIDWFADPAGGGVRVLTRTSTYTADRLVLCPGAAAPTLLANLGIPLLVEPRSRHRAAAVTTPSGHFVLGPHPRHQQVIVACGFAGHGSALAPVIGEIVADLLTRHRSRHAIETFDPRRQYSGAEHPSIPIHTPS